MRILITGGRGFIGSHLGNRLVELGHDVIGCDNGINPCSQPLNFECIDHQAKHWRDFSKIDAVFHLAAWINVDESIAMPDEYLYNNSVETTELLLNVRKTNDRCKVIYASSAEVYGNARHQVMDEGHPLDPLSPYAVSKLAAEQMCKNFAQLYGMDVTVIRNFNTFGPYQRGGQYGGVIAKFKAQAKKGEAITVYGSGEQMRDYMYIDQAVAGYVLALEAQLPTIVNFGSGVPVRIIDIANHIAKKFNAKVVHLKARPNEIMRLQADVSRAKQYGYRIETDFWKHLDTFLEYES